LDVKKRVPSEFKDFMRFRAEGKNDYFIYYNPCSSFNLGDGCVDDVAVCQSPKNGASYDKIGDQSTASCDTKTEPPKLLYKTAAYEERRVKVVLICNRTKKIIDKETFRQSPDDEWTYYLTHNCACPNACPEGPSTTGPTLVPKSTHSGTPNPGNSWKKIWEPITIVAGGVAFVIAVVVTLWLLHKRYCLEEYNHERRHLLGDVENGVDEAKNIFPVSNDGGRSANLRNASPPLSASSSSNIKVPKKDDCNKAKDVNVSV